MVILGLVVDVGDPLPAEEDVRRRLHQMLAPRDALAVAGVLAVVDEPPQNEARASFACRNSRSLESRPSISKTHWVPTLPTPNTLARHVHTAELLDQVMLYPRAPR